MCTTPWDIFEYRRGITDNCRFPMQKPLFFISNEKNNYRGNVCVCTYCIYTYVILSTKG